MNGQNQNNQNRQPSTLSGGEKFVAINLLSKIGTVFVIASVIAFSAASEGHIPDLVRLILVLAVGLIMIGAGELFRRKGSEIFANTMVYGGVVELMICAPIGRYGLHIFNNIGMLVYSAIAAAFGFLLAWRYRSQILLIIMAAASMIPGFALITSNTDLSYLFLPVYFVMTHFAIAVISRRFRFNAASITGMCAAGAEIFFVLVFSSQYITKWVRIYAPERDAIPNTPVHTPDNFYVLEDFSEIAPMLFAVIFLICCMLCYSGSALLNSVESDGEMSDIDCASLGISQGLVIFFTTTLLADDSVKTSGVILAILTVLYTLTAIAFSLKFWFGSRTNTVLINLALSSASLALLLLIDAGNWQYIAMHTFAAAVLIAGFFLERPLFKWWGASLLSISEILFFVVLVQSSRMPESYKLSAAIVNLILWFGIMAVLGMLKKTRESAGFRLYSFAALLNAGLVCSNLISDDLMKMLRLNGALTESAQRHAFSGLLCAAVWMILGFIAGKLPYLNKWRAPASITHYAIGFCCLGWANFANTFSNSRNSELETMLVIATVIVNVVSVLAVLDITLQIQEKASKFSRVIGLIVSAYAMMTLTTILGTNNTVKFTSCIISILYLALAAAWIIIGFWRNNPILRRFGLALALFSSAKLFLFDFQGVDAFGRTLLFIGFGVTLLGISFGYAVMEKRLSRRENPPEPVDKSQQK